MAVTYTVTEVDGFQHTRTSRAENTQRYFWAVVRVPHGRKSLVSYHATRERAQTELRNAEAHMLDGKRYYPDAKLYPVTAVVK